MKPEESTRANDGPGWAVVAVLFAIGVALGSIITRAPVRTRMPMPMSGGSGMKRSSGPALSPEFTTLLPFYVAALAFPVFLWLARRAPLSREQWRRSVVLWLIAIVLVATLPDLVMLALFGNVGAFDFSLLTFLAMRSLSTGPLILGAAALAHAIEQRRRARLAQTALVQAQLHALTAQLRPHFLFNTLQSVSTLIHRDANAADAMIGRLGDLLRASLDVGNKTFVPLEEELRITEAYAGIMRERFGERLSVSIESSADQNLLVPPFLLQPLVENAIQHGIEPMRGNGAVRISVSESHDQLHLEVADTGTGMRENNGDGVGLGNTRQRLLALYGEQAQLSIDARPAGTTVTVVIPCRPR